MVKVSNLIKTLLPIGVVIGGLIFLSQSRRVNIFRTTQAPDIQVKPVQAYPVFINEPQIVPVPFQETPASLYDRYGELYTKTETRVETTKQNPEYAKRYFGSGQRADLTREFNTWLEANRTFEMIPQYTPLFQLE